MSGEGEGCVEHVDVAKHLWLGVERHVRHKVEEVERVVGGDRLETLGDEAHRARDDREATLAERVENLVG